MKRSENEAEVSLRQHIVFGCVLLVLLVGGAGGWAATTEISGAVVASGSLVVESSVKKVQNPVGGTVSELKVRDGDHVVVGQTLLRLDETLNRANLTAVTKNLNELRVRQLRLDAERRGETALEFPGALPQSANDDILRIISSERKLFEVRLNARLGKKAQLREQIGQLRQQARGFSDQSTSKAKEIELIAKELAGVRELWQQHLVPISRVTSLERQAVSLDGERNQLLTSAAQTNGKINETELQIIQIDEDLRTEVAKELRDVQAQIEQLTEKEIAAKDQLSRTDIRAPQDGIVQQLAVHTAGEVISAGEPIMLIVPQTDELRAEVKVPPQHIDQLATGQLASVRFPAFDQRTTPELDGVLSRVSADTIQDPKTGAPYYLARVSISEKELERLGALKLVPGMPVDVFVRTSERTVISYLIKPFRDQIVRAFRER
ncbi:MULTISPECIES: HlyD family type I secretion periplasmic adaptor subunit [unclassified Bradyrhizobium]|uniref:HlyD family type I secretion periplasmic adaptor subunit n=1 Tax=unclassified Bradyrhizobium TaxID=2631580 RepID=UPI00211DC9FF|nr:MULTISPECIES: HlyD family type I secretion periplasmic adaptor subunit [unclassified Bradyrhizobium]MDD1532493.1 HlyD family type I secretion periplasmic adaptor subunit [Bradyrhizobium sp. WBOS8]MDD1582497.1 HlyD family type I secretion periplasmic adaptor subunit [Bradyrhizobium sp. WBOS4]UUO50860.1 HlyD family type I secretion periplasmic adaptor subunit [Bradyrhizobium sp. WBOS04]UUO58239.1 HlyD family type I secretion periplasmic adaptor subunit [Bradyrhizobium sp. WBOS08]